ncbi:MAG: flagellar FlbD family protein [Planctomycetota bacterium]
MLQLNKLNDQQIFVNADVILYIEQMPDTVLTLINKEKIIVKEEPKAIIQKFIEYKRMIHLFPGGI